MNNTSVRINARYLPEDAEISIFTRHFSVAPAELSKVISSANNVEIEVIDDTIDVTYKQSFFDRAKAERAMRELESKLNSSFS